MSKDYYKILEIERGSSEEEIKKAYRKMAMKWHPDKNPGNSAAEEKFKECAEAFDVLSDPQKKQQYDTFGSVGGNSGFGHNPFEGFGGMDDIFSRFGDFFGFSGGQPRTRQKRGQDIRIKIQLSLNDVIFGCQKKIKYVRQVKCVGCEGVGGKDLSVCGVCQGTGQRKIVQNSPFGQIQQVIVCNSCDGSGKVVRNNCHICNGQGTTSNEESIDITIPKGVQTGNVLNMQQMGNFPKGGYPGDLHILVDELSDNDFKREDNNLIYEQSISVIDAILGKKINLRTPHGEIQYNVESGTTHGKVYRIKNKGVPDLNTGSLGDLLIKMNIKVPQQITDTERVILQNLQKSPNFS